MWSGVPQSANAACAEMSDSISGPETLRAAVRKPASRPEDQPRLALGFREVGEGFPLPLPMLVVADLVQVAPASAGRVDFDFVMVVSEDDRSFRARGHVVLRGCQPKCHASSRLRRKCLILRASKWLWKQIGKRPNHYLDCEAMQAAAATMLKLIGREAVVSAEAAK